MLISLFFHSSLTTNLSKNLVRGNTSASCSWVDREAVNQCGVITRKQATQRAISWGSWYSDLSDDPPANWNQDFQTPTPGPVVSMFIKLGESKLIVVVSSNPLILYNYVLYMYIYDFCEGFVSRVPKFWRQFIGYSSTEVPCHFSGADEPGESGDARLPVINRFPNDFEFDEVSPCLILHKIIFYGARVSPQKNSQMNSVPP